MGGPSAAAYRAAEEARRKRRDALRTRDGVVDLAEWRAAVRSARFLEKQLAGSHAVVCVRPAAAATVGFELRGTLWWRDPDYPGPTAVDEIPVRYRVRGGGW